MAEPRRREVIDLLARNGQMTASDISDNFRISPQAVSQHLRVLLETDLVEVEKQAQTRIYKLNPHKVDELERWVQQLRKNWNERFERLYKFPAVEKEKL